MHLLSYSYSWLSVVCDSVFHIIFSLSRTQTQTQHFNVGAHKIREYSDIINHGEKKVVHKFFRQLLRGANNAHPLLLTSRNGANSVSYIILYVVRVCVYIV